MFAEPLSRVGIGVDGSCPMMITTDPWSFPTLLRPAGAAAQSSAGDQQAADAHQHLPERVFGGNSLEK